MMRCNERVLHPFACRFSKFPPRFRHRTPISTISQLQKVAQDIEFNGGKWWVVQGSNL
jgi:hypothetical protein